MHCDQALHSHKISLRNACDAVMTRLARSLTGHVFHVNVIGIRVRLFRRVWTKGSTRVRLNRSCHSRCRCNIEFHS